ncbi:Mitochondrial Carrier (MC) protein [Phytophthora megakarya]|uniref:Mitochondrial Carrier (MC) protein n=1 Tax=Phytophthora megakarya TaxID=4795 RepID=A0A225WSX9_9STRA|nr:Mitochondrial Carrier (MC) protein [Phytophthora megakarya]
MGLYGGAICVCAKFFGQTQWDHNGVVVRAPSLAPDAKHPEDELFLLEAALTGVKLRPLVARILLSRGHEVAVRKVQVDRTSELQNKAEQFALGSLNAPYEDNPARFFNAGVSVPTRIARERIFAALMSTKKELARLDTELAHRDKMPVFERKALLHEREAVNLRYQTLGAELRGTERSMFENAVVEGKSKMFCSQLVAGLYQHLGLLLPYPSANSYLPKHFSARDGGDFLKLQQSASFLPEISMRKELQKMAERYATRTNEAKERGPRAGTETAAIVHCLRRHQLFHTMNEPELLAAASQFRRRVLAKGEVVFYQGAPGDCFYIIERGDCEVFVDYDHLLKTQPALQAADSKNLNPELQRRIQLRKRKTIALPEFKSSSSLVGNNERVHVATNGPGNAFGESALIYDTPRRATIQATSSGPDDDEEPVVLWQLDKPTFREILTQHPGSQQSLEERRFLLEALEDHPLFTELDDRAKALAVHPQQIQLVRHSANEDEDDDDFRTPLFLPAPLPSAQAYDRASNIDQLLSEAAFRVLKSITSTYDGGNTCVPTASASLLEQDDADKAAIKLNDLPRAIHQWISTSETAEALKKLETPTQMTPDRLAFYERLFDLPEHKLGDQYVTHDDLVRGIAAIEMEDARSEEDENDAHIQSEDVTAAKEEFRAFLTVLKSDINALRTIWRAAELQAHGGDGADMNNDLERLTFDANLKSGWISALRQNPTGGDWEYLQPEMEDNRQVYNKINATVRRQRLTAQVTSFAAAIAAGALARTVCAPLERLKMLMQLSIPKQTQASAAKLFSGTAPYTSLTRGFLNMVKISGPRSLFSGNLAHCIWVVPSVPTKVILCHVYQKQLAHMLPESPSPFGSTSMTNLAVGGLAGLTLNCLFYPLDVIRGRLTVQQYYNANRPSSGMLKCARLIRDKEGFQGFYRGFMPASLGVSTYIGCNFALYESLRPVFVLYDTEDTSNQLGHPSVPGQILCATTASLASQCISYPFDVIRRRVQLQGAKWHPELAFPTYDSAWDCVRSSIAEEGGGVRGLRSLYRGLFVNAVKALPSTVISFLSYEKLREMNHSVDDA